MKGLDRVIEIRGGADKLGMDGLLERLFNWYLFSYTNLGHSSN